MLEKYPWIRDGLFTWEKLNIFPFGSYDVLIGMDWFEAHQVKHDYYEKKVECIGEERSPSIVRGYKK